MKVNRTGATSIHVSWDAPTEAVVRYEVFYSGTGEARRSILTTETGADIEGLVLGQTYSVFVVAFGFSADTLPSPPNNITTITLGTYDIHSVYYYNYKWV